MDEREFSWGGTRQVLVLDGEGSFLGKIPGGENESGDGGVGDSEVVFLPVDEWKVGFCRVARVASVVGDAKIENHFAHVAEQADCVGFLVVEACLAGENLHADSAGEGVFPKFRAGDAVSAVVLGEELFGSGVSDEFEEFSKADAVDRFVESINCETDGEHGAVAQAKDAGGECRVGVYEVRDVAEIGAGIPQ